MAALPGILGAVIALMVPTLCGATVQERPPGQDRDVEVALVLAVDVSSSISAEERRFQRHAYAEALSDPRIANAAVSGGGIAIGYMEWSGPGSQRIIIPMRVARAPREIGAVAEMIRSIEDRPNDPMYFGATAIGNALGTASAMLSPYAGRAEYLVVDISGDGLSNSGVDVSAVRDRMVTQGITINGLPIANERSQGEDVPIDVFFENCVIGGRGAFQIMATDWSDFRETLMAKLVLEVAGHRLPATERQRWAARAREVGEETALMHPATLSLNPLPKPTRPRIDCGQSRRAQSSNGKRAN